VDLCQRKLESYCTRPEEEDVEGHAGQTSLDKTTAALAVACFNYAVELEHTRGKKCLEVRTICLAFICMCDMLYTSKTANRESYYVV